MSTATHGSVERAGVKPVLVLGLGNVLLCDDGVGPVLVEELARSRREDSSIEFLDGGTQGLNPLGALAGRAGLLILDAYRSGQPPGSLTVLRSPGYEQLATRKSGSAHEGNAGELLLVASLTGDLPQRVCILGVEPERIEPHVGLSDRVEAALPRALELAQQLIVEMSEEPVCA